MLFLCPIGGEILRKLKNYKPTKFKAKDSYYDKEYADFAVVTRSRTVVNYLRTYDQLFDIGKELLLQVDDIEERKIRLMGLTLKNAGTDQVVLTNQPLQLTLEFKE